jgi:hypothetical protein
LDYGDVVKCALKLSAIVSFEPSISMNFINNIGVQHQPVRHIRVYQDARDSSQHWRQQDRILHPLTQKQFGNRFRVGDRFRMRLVTPTSTKYADLTIVKIVPYYEAQQWIGSYNADDTFKDVPFSNVLVLRP